MNNLFFILLFASHAVASTVMGYTCVGRVTSTIGGATTRWYWAGQTEIEERDAADVLVRYHVNGPLHMDERVATIEAAGRGTGEDRYYLPGLNGSIVGAGSADGLAIEKFDYSATGDFAGGAGGGGFHHDFDDDGRLGLRDYIHLQTCFGRTTPGCLDVNDFGSDGGTETDGDVDVFDFDQYAECFAGAIDPPNAGCEAAGGGGANIPRSGTFTLHGRPIDVIPGGAGRGAEGDLVLTYVRARYYDAKHGRWLQRDPSGYVDGNNAYEAYRGNALSFTDPSGEGILTWLLGGDYSRSDWAFVRAGGLTETAAGFGSGAVEAATNVGIGAAKGGREVAYIAADIVVAPFDIGSTLIFHEPLGKPFSQVGGASTNPDSLGDVMAESGKIVVLNGVTLGGYGVVEGTVEYYRTGDEEAFSQNVGGQGLLTLATAGAVKVRVSGGLVAGATPEALAVRSGVLGNIAESQAARAASRFEVFALREAQLESSRAALLAWQQRVAAGRAFNVANAARYPHNEVYVVNPKGGYWVVDSYRIGEIISRRNTQLSAISERSGVAYLNEALRKYAPGRQIADVPSTPGVLIGEQLKGRLFLEVPIQMQSVPQSILNAATEKLILIRDVEGTVYNP